MTRDRGLGDSVARVTRFFGVQPCDGCKRRQAWLNEAVPYAPQVFAGETEGTSAPPLEVGFPRPWLEAEPRTGAGAEYVRAAAETMRAGWQEAHGRAPSDAELLFSLAVGKLESGFGRGWKDPCRESNNWGAVQCRAGQAPCCEYQDSHADGRPYAVGFRVYASPASGAADLVRHLTTHRPLTWAVMQKRAPTIWEFSRAMRVERYYGGRCPKATASYGAGVVVHYGEPPAGDAAKAACHEEAIEGHVKAVSAALREIAPAIGLPMPDVGTPGGVGSAVAVAKGKLVAAGVAAAVTAALLARWLRG